MSTVSYFLCRLKSYAKRHQECLCTGLGANIDRYSLLKGNSMKIQIEVSIEEPKVSENIDLKGKDISGWTQTLI